MMVSSHGMVLFSFPNSSETYVYFLHGSVFFCCCFSVLWGFFVFCLPPGKYESKTNVHFSYTAIPRGAMFLTTHPVLQSCSLLCFAKSPVFWYTVICYSQFPCLHIVKGNVVEILKKAVGNAFIPESLESYKNKRLLNLGGTNREDITSEYKQDFLLDR